MRAPTLEGGIAPDQGDATTRGDIARGKKQDDPINGDKLLRVLAVELGATAETIGRSGL